MEDLGKNYFRHNYGERLTPKMLKLRKEMGLFGVGVYWCIVEKLFENGGSLCLDDLTMFAFELHLNEDKEIQDLQKVVTDFNLFEINEETGEFTSKSIQEQIDYRKGRSEEARRKAAMRWSKEKPQSEQIDEETGEIYAESQNNDAPQMTLSEFIREHPKILNDIPNTVSKNKAINWDLLSYKIKHNSALQSITSLSSLVNKYQKIVDGYYD